MKIETILKCLDSEMSKLVDVAKTGDSKAKAESDIVASKCEFAKKLLDAGVLDTDEVTALVPVPAPAPAPPVEPNPVPKTKTSKKK